MMKNLQIVLYVACFLIANPMASQNIEIYEVPYPALENIITTSDGREWQLGPSKTKLRVVNFWAIWCAPCVQELQSLSQLKGRFSKEEVDVLTIATGKHHPSEVDVMFAKLSVKNLPKFFDQNGKLAAEIGAPTVPYTVFLDENGKEIGRIIGAAQWDSAEMISQIRIILETLK